MEKSQPEEVSDRNKRRRAIIIPETDSESSGDEVVPNSQPKILHNRSNSVEHQSPSEKRRLDVANDNWDVPLSLDLEHSDPSLEELLTQTSQLSIRESSGSLRFESNSSLHNSPNISNLSSLASTGDEIHRQNLNRSSPDSVISEAPQKQSRNRPARPLEWKRTKARIARNSGQPYVSANGQHQQPRKLLPPCSCSMHCSQKISGKRRLQIHRAFWELADINRQREIIGKLVKIKRVGRHRVDDDKSRRRYTLIYRLKLHDSYVKTCKVFFLNTLGIGEKILRVVMEKMNRSETGALSPDRRGRHIPAHKLSNDDIAGIRRHISSLPKVPAHSCRRDSAKTYLEGSLTKDSVHQLHLSYAAEHGLRKLSKPTYTQQLEVLNIGFHQPRKDQCWCANFHAYSPEDKVAKQDEYDLHVRRKEAAREQKVLDTNAAEDAGRVMTATFDLEAILYSPFISSKQLFYKRKLATLNFTVFVVKKKQGYCCMWPEYCGKKGSQEISTCLAKFIDEEVPNGIEKLNLYADNCAGQNKNSIITSMLGDALQSHPSLRKINLKFLEAGHMYMECDTMHFTIERAARNQEIYVPRDWAKIVRHAKKSGKPYSVYQMNYFEFLNYKGLKDKIFPRNLQYTDRSKVKWRAAKWIQIRRNHSRSVFIKPEYWEPFKELILSKPFKSRTLDQLYDAPLPIQRTKYNDLISLCQSLVIPKQHHRFYRDLSVDSNDAEDTADGRARVPR